MYQTASQSEALPRYRLDVEHAGEVVVIPLSFDKPNLVVGRGEDDEGVDVDLSPFEAHDRGVSRQHATLSLELDGLYLTDWESTNGTRLNGIALVGGQPYRLRSDDEIVFGQLRTSIRFGH